MKHIVFPTYELHPVNPGGAGVLVAGMVRSLARDGFRCTILCDFPEGEIETARQGFAGEGFGETVRLESVAQLGGKSLPGPFASVYEANSAGFARALATLHARDPIDLIEFPEYAGMAVETLRNRPSHPTRGVPRVAVRIHGSLEAIDRAEGVKVQSIERLRMYQLERLGMRGADLLLTPSVSLGQEYQRIYGLSDAQRVLSPPPMVSLLWEIKRADRLPDPHHFLFYGKLQEVKGCDLIVDAANALISERPKARWRFTFVGRDTHCAAHEQATSKCLLARIPPRHRDFFDFVPSIARHDLSVLTRRPVAAIIASRFETFCLAAHELRATGLPLIVSRIPAFRDYLRPETGCLTFDGSASSLAVAMRRIVDEPGLAETLAACDLPPYRSPFEAYQEALGRELAGHPEGVRAFEAELAAFDRLGAPAHSAAQGS
jgi:glycosyltransferase involved in cell wall biosynthesis